MVARTKLVIDRLIDFINWTIRVTDLHILETQNATCMIIVGILMAFAGDQLYSRNPKAWQMFEALPNEIWGGVYALTGVVHIYVLKHHNEVLRKWILLVAWALWVFIGTALAVGAGWYVPAVYIYYVFAAVALRGYFKIQLEVRAI